VRCSAVSPAQPVSYGGCWYGSTFVPAAVFSRQQVPQALYGRREKLAGARQLQQHNSARQQQTAAAAQQLELRRAVCLPDTCFLQLRRSPANCCGILHLINHPATNCQHAGGAVGRNLQC
jgi:hypothetical protein